MNELNFFGELFTYTIKGMDYCVKKKPFKNENSDIEAQVLISEISSVVGC